MRYLPLAAAFLLLLSTFAVGQESAGGRQFTVDPATSAVTIRLYRDGVLAKFAHDHVLVAGGIAGIAIYNAEEITRSSLQLSVPVASLVVDDPEHRKREGLDGTLSASDAAKIRAIVMGPDYLDEPNAPRVVATTVGVNGTLPLLSITLSVRIKQAEKTYTVPVQVKIEGDTLRATGELYLKHSDFGMKPYRAMLGAVSVQDPILVKFDIVAREQR